MRAGASRSVSILIKVGLRVPPPATIQLAGMRENALSERATAAAVIAVSVAAPSAVLLPASRPYLLPFQLAVGPIAGRTETADLFAVGLYERNVDAVIGSAAHQADGRHRSH
jgi:hypothetical protein